jgi:hypothetical protein
MGHRRIAAARRAVEDLQAERAVADEALARGVFHVEFRIQLGGEHHRELQALGFVHAHEADGVLAGAVRVGGSPVLSAVGQRFEELHKPPQRRAGVRGAEMLKLDGVVVQFQEVGPPLAAVGQGGIKRQEVVLAEDAVQQIGQRAAAASCASRKSPP